MINLWSWQQGVLDPRGPVAAAERMIIINSGIIMLAVILPVIVLTLAFAWWYRADNKRATYLGDWSYSGRVEVVIWSVPALVIMFLGGICWIGSHELDPPKPLQSTATPVKVSVIALDWKWLFVNEDEHVASVNRLVVPAGVPIAFRLTSHTVMNSFFVPQLGSQIYTMAGMTANLHLQADFPGEYAGFSAQYSGTGFSDMRFVVEAVPRDKYDAYIAAAHADKPMLTMTRFKDLAKPSINVAPETYGAVTADLFEKVRDRSTDEPRAAAMCGPSTVTLADSRR